MPVNHEGEVKLGVVLHSKLIGYLWIINDNVYFMDDIDEKWEDPTHGYSILSNPVSFPVWDKLIQCSPFSGKNGRLLWEGDEVEDDTQRGVVEMDDCGMWIMRITDVCYYRLTKSQMRCIEYTGSIYLKGEMTWIG